VATKIRVNLALISAAGSVFRPFTSAAL